jgi:hypothetical protein
MSKKEFPIMPESRSAPQDLNLAGNYRSGWRGEPKGPIQKPSGALASFENTGYDSRVQAGEKITPRKKEF